MLKRLIGLFGIFTKRELRSSLSIMNKLYKLVIALTSLITHTSLTQTITETFGSGANQFSIDFVTIGNPGNVPHPSLSVGPIGSVNYVYNIGKYEISREMIQNASNLGNLGITLGDMGSALGNGNMRPGVVSWNEAARFINWLNVSKGYSTAYKFSSQPGDGGYNSNSNVQQWTSGESGYNPINPYRNSNAFYFMPNLDEWHKAAYYNPNTGTYSHFANGSNVAPIAVAEGTDPNTAVYDGQSAPADINNAGGLSPYGTMAQGGNVWEWQETDTYSTAKGVRGGAAGNWAGTIAADSMFPSWPSSEHEKPGFRIAAVPEPSALSLLAIGLGGLAMMRRRRS